MFSTSLPVTLLHCFVMCHSINLKENCTNCVLGSGIRSILMAANKYFRLRCLSLSRHI